MSRHTVELCTLLVEDMLGDLAAAVFGILAQLGRLPLEQLLQKGKLSREQVKHGLATLIQHHLVYWGYDTLDEEGSPHYEARFDRAFKLAQYGRYARAVETQYGKTAAQLLVKILLQGSAHVSDLLEEWQKDRTSTPANLSNGKAPQKIIANGQDDQDTEDDDGSSEEGGDGATGFHVAFNCLREAKLVLEFHDSFRRPESDNRKIAEYTVAQRPKYEKGIKGQTRREFEADFQKMCRAWRHGSGDYDDDAEESAKLSIKRKAPKSDTGPRPSKKLRIGVDGGPIGPPGTGTDDIKSRELVCVNFDKLDVLLRNDILVQEAEQSIGPFTAKIYATVLQLATAKTESCRPMFIKDEDLVDDNDVLPLDPIINGRTLIQQLLPMKDIETSIAPLSVDASHISPATYARQPPTWRAPPASPSDDDDDNDDDDDDEGSDTHMSDNASAPRPRGSTQVNGHVDGAVDHRHIPPDRSSVGLLRQHLFLLASHRLPFLEYHTSSGTHSEQWSVPLLRLVRELRTDAICQTIHEQHDEPALAANAAPTPDAQHPRPPEPADTTALRIARVLVQAGKLDEKALAARVLVPPKQLRARCATLHAAGHLEMQDVPRDAQRQPARTVFLYFLDPPRAAARVAEDARASMARLLRRRAAERAARRGVLEKAGRSDVRGHETELLSKAERAQLRAWHARETRMWGALVRLAEMTALLSEY